MDTVADLGCAGRAPFVGRAVELDRLDALLRHRVEGTGPVAAAVAVEVVGEPGIGKSRLLAEFAVRARRRGATVLRGRAGPTDRHPGPPFQAFADAFADLDHRDRATSCGPGRPFGTGRADIAAVRRQDRSGRPGGWRRLVPLDRPRRDSRGYSGRLGRWARRGVHVFRFG